MEKRNDDRCVCCGATIPEGRQVCPGCEKQTGGKAMAEFELYLKEDIKNDYDKGYSIDGIVKRYQKTKKKEGIKLARKKPKRK